MIMIMIMITITNDNAYIDVLIQAGDAGQYRAVAENNSGESQEN